MATTVTLSIAFLPPIGDTCKSHVNVHGHCDKIYHQLMATQVKFPRKSLAVEAAHSLRHALESRPKTIGANFEHFWLFVGPNLLINARTLTSGISAGTLAPRIANWLPKFDGILFSALGSIQGYKV